MRTPAVSHILNIGDAGDATGDAGYKILPINTLFYYYRYMKSHGTSP
jgi:hypothetical protein